MTIFKLASLFLFIISSSIVHAKSALIIVDMQNCFVPGEDSKVHSLPVNGGMDIVPGINHIQEKFDYVVATKDWHPAGHVSFASSHKGMKPFENKTLKDGLVQTLWPDHCVANTKGAEFVTGLETNSIDKIIYKGDNRHVDSYSGFFDNARKGVTELDSYLKGKGVTEIYVVGLAADFCVKFTSIDGAFLKYDTYFIKDLTKAVFPDNLEESTYSQLRANGVKIISSSEI